MIKERYYLKEEFDEPFDTVVEKARNALATAGFGIMTEIDVEAVLKKKLDADFRPYIILGACIPSSAYEVLKAEEQIGLMLPCNVVVQEMEGGKTVVSSINPEEVMQPVGNPELAPVAGEVAGKFLDFFKAL